MPGNRASLIGRATAGVAFFFIVALLLPLDPISGFTLKKSGGKESLLPSEEIELFIQGKVSLLDNFSSDQLLFFADRIFEQEFSEGKRVLRERGEKDGEQYAFSFTKTISFLDEIIEKRGDDRFMDRFLYLRAYCYLEQGNLEKANRDFIEIAEKYNRSSLLPEVHFRLAEYYFSTEQIALALEAYEKVVEEKESPYYDKALYKIGWAYYLTSNFEKAIGYFTRLADLSYIPSKKDRVRNDRYEGEEGVLGSEDLSNEGLAYAAICYTNMGDAGQVLKTLSGKVKPYSSMLYGELAQAYFDQSKYEDFLLVFDEVLRRFKKVPVVLEMQKEIVTIQEISLSDKTAARTRKEKFVETFFPHMISKEMFLYREKLSRHLRPMIRELASYYHREAGTSGKKELFKKAGGYYEKYLELYEKARDVKKMTLYFAETLYESGRFFDAAKQFEKVASF
ncbi:MAG: tol-pal system YbgF family protein, partial [Nitrospinota bacterium]